MLQLIVDWFLYSLLGFDPASAAAGVINYVPQAASQAIISKAGIFLVPSAVALGVPMYGSCAAIVPVADEAAAGGHIFRHNGSSDYIYGVFV